MNSKFHELKTQIKEINERFENTTENFASKYNDLDTKLNNTVKSIDVKFNERDEKIDKQICEITFNIESKISNINEQMADQIKTQVEEQCIEIENKCVTKINERNDDIEFKIMEVELSLIHI